MSKINWDKVTCEDVTPLFPTLGDRLALQPSRPLTTDEEADAARYFETVRADFMMIDRHDDPNPE